MAQKIEKVEGERLEGHGTPVLVPGKPLLNMNLGSGS